MQDVIEAAGHLYLFLPKFHYELNYMGDDTLDILKESMPKAVASVPLQTIRRWEHRMYRWMGQDRVPKMLRYKSVNSVLRHINYRRIPDTIANAFD